MNNLSTLACSLPFGFSQRLAADGLNGFSLTIRLLFAKCHLFPILSQCFSPKTLSLISGSSACLIGTTCKLPWVKTSKYSLRGCLIKIPVPIFIMHAFASAIPPGPEMWRFISILPTGTNISIPITKRMLM